MPVLVSVIIPVYNNERTIKKCIDSILDQTLKDIEIIVVNDNSVDNTLEILKEYKGIIVINNKRNLGPSGSRNKGLEVAKGKYIGFVDGDDYIKESMYEKMVSYMQNENVDLVCCTRYNILNGIVKKKKGHSGIKSSKDFLQNSLGVWDKLFKKSIIDKYKIRFLSNCNHAEDFNFLAKYYYYSDSTYFTDEAFYFYVNDTNGSICNTYNSNCLDIIKAFEDVVAFYKEKNEFEKYEDLIMKVSAGYYVRELKKFKKYNNAKLKKSFVKRYLKYFKCHYKVYKKYINRYGTKKSLFFRSNCFLLNLYVYYTNLKYNFSVKANK